MSSRLADASSLYLRQHAQDPVDWFPWGAQAFDEARRRDVPVFVSIGYAACHWCHVMAEESFRDAGIAAQLAADFVAVKVDREEHPDVDGVYMAATQALTGHGGWPMSVFLLPDGRVFHAGTYFPARRRGSVPSFSEVLDSVRQTWTTRRAEVERSAGEIAQALGRQRMQQAALATVIPSDAAGEDRSGNQVRELADQALAALAEDEDRDYGGYGGSPKFPPSPLLGMLLDQAARGDEQAAGQAARTLTAMGRSALCDQVDGGFSRYATDRAWALPHFEKMLVDNAQLLGHYARLAVLPASVLASAGLTLGVQDLRTDAERTARATAQWMRRRLLTDDGLLASSLDADVHLADGSTAEGATYVVTDDQLRATAQALGLTQEQGQRLVELNAGIPVEQVEASAATGATPRTVHFAAPLTADDRALWEPVAEDLRRQRQDAPQPSRDEKVVTAWNAMAVRALAEAGACLEDEALVSFAVSLGQRLWELHVVQEPGRAGVLQVRRISYAGTAEPRPGTLGDWSQLASACFALASVSGHQEAAVWRDRGHRVLSGALAEFLRRAPDGTPVLLEALDEDGLLRTAQQAPLLAAPLDDAEPSPVAALAFALQSAEALGVTVTDAEAEQVLEVSEVLRHLPLVAPKAPVVVGASLQVALRRARGSAALRLSPAGAASPGAGGGLSRAAVRRLGALYGVPVEPETDTGAGQSAGETAGQGAGDVVVGLCLNAPEARVCLPPIGDEPELVASLQVASAQDQLGQPPSRANMMAM